MPELRVQALTANIAVITDFIDSHLEEADCPLKAQTQIDIAVDEICSNIAFYAYGPEKGDILVSYDFDPDTRLCTITFSDSGIPFDPLAVKEPDTTVPVEERDIGGMGIFLVRKTMDQVSYEYKDGMNHLTIQKRI